MELDIKVKVSKTEQRIADRLRDAFPKEWLHEQAAKTGLVKRLRDFDPVILFWVLVLNVGTETVACLETLRRNYNKAADKAMAYSSFYERFTPELVAYLHACVLRGMEHLASWSDVRLADSLKGFKDILIQDSTIIRLHEKLQDKYPITRGRKAAAGVKLSCLMSVVADGPKTLRLFPERTAETKTLRIGSWVKDCILLVDLGFYKHHAFAKIKENGGHFVSRLKDNADPYITKVLNNVRGNSVEVEGNHLRDVLSRLKREVLDCEVELDFRRRNYKGKTRQDTLRVRLVSIRNDETGEYHSYLTTLGGQFTPHEVASLYRCRWEVEILFRQLKDKHGLDKIPFSNENAVQAILWTSILTMLVQRCLYHTVREDNPKLRKNYSREKSAKQFKENVPKLFILLFHWYGLEYDIAEIAFWEDCGAFNPYRENRSHLQEWEA